MSVIHFVWPGPPEQRASAKLTAMQPISVGLAEACSKLKPALDPSTLRVTFNKKPVDVSLPWRLANIPAGTSLRLEPLAAGAPPPSTLPDPAHIAPPQPPQPAAGPPPQSASTAATPPSQAAPPPQAASAAASPSSAPQAAQHAAPQAAQETVSAPPISTPPVQPQAAPQAAPPQAAAQQAAPQACTPQSPIAAMGPAQVLAPPAPAPTAAASASAPPMGGSGAEPMEGVLEAQPQQAAHNSEVPPPAAQEVQAAAPARALGGGAEPMDGVLEAQPQQAAQAVQSGPPTSQPPPFPLQPAEQLPSVPASLHAQPSSQPQPTVPHEPQPQERPSPAAPSQTPLTPAAPQPNSPLSRALGISREAILLTEEALHQVTASSAGSGAPPVGTELPDEFFELTAEDYAAWARAAEAKKREENAGFKTKAMREQEARAKAEAFGSVPVRVHLPTGKLVLQAAFAATETIGALQALVRQTLQPSMASAFYLYTTPPRQVLKDSDATLYQSGLVPAAHVHLGLDAKKVPGGSGSVPAEGLLCPEALQHAIRTVPPAAEGQLQLPGQQSEVEAEREQRQKQLDRAQAKERLQGLGGVSAGASSSSAGRPGTARGSEGGPKVPKWLKLK